MSEETFFMSGRPVVKSTLLYGMLPRNFGTGDVESISSYLHSLAYAHRLSSRNLVHSVLSPLFAKHTMTGPHVFWPETRSPICGASNHADIFAKVLMEATGQSAAIYSTLVPLRHLVSTIGLATKNRRVCLKCLQEDIGSGGLPYGRLLWRIRLVSCCPIHKTCLVEPVCSRKHFSPQGLFNKGFPEGACKSCGNLGFACSYTRGETAADSEIIRAQQCRNLIAAFSSLQHLNASEVKRAFAIYSKKHGGYAQIARDACLSKSLLARWLNEDDTRIVLRAFFDLANAVGVEVVDLLSGNLEGVSCSLKQVVLRQKRVSLSLNDSVINVHMSTALDHGKSIGSVAAELGVSTKILGIKSPEIYRRIVEFTTGKIRKNIDLESARVVDEACQVFFLLLQNRQTPSLRNASRITGDAWYPKDRRSIALILLRQEFGDCRVSANLSGGIISENFHKKIKEAAISLKNKLAIEKLVLPEMKIRKDG